MGTRITVFGNRLTVEGVVGSVQSFEADSRVLNVQITLPVYVQV